MNPYLTIASASEAEIIEKKSRFTARVSHVASESEALAFIEGVKNFNREASHNVYAFRVGIDMIYEKYSDAGEPSGTAGLPVLSVLKKENLTNAAVVVTRIFGGILLGAGGLARAYAAACKAGIDAAGIKLMRATLLFTAAVSYAHVGRLQRDESRGYIIRDVIYSERAEFVLHSYAEDADGVIKYILDFTNGTAEIIKKEMFYS